MVSAAKYTPRGPNTLTLLFHDHFDAFSQSYDSLYAKDYGRFRLERISRVAERFEICGDYTKGIARIKCSNPLGGSRATPPGAESRREPRMPNGVFSSLFMKPFNDFLRANAHWHALVLEGGFSPDGRFLFLPIHDMQKITEAFRRAVTKLLLSKALISEEFAFTFLCWKNSDFLAAKIA